LAPYILGTNFYTVLRPLFHITPIDKNVKLIDISSPNHVLFACCLHKQIVFTRSDSLTLIHDPFDETVIAVTCLIKGIFYFALLLQVCQ